MKTATGKEKTGRTAVTQGAQAWRPKRGFSRRSEALQARIIST